MLAVMNPTRPDLPYDPTMLIAAVIGMAALIGTIVFLDWMRRRV